jgi:hypothetical protein
VSGQQHAAVGAVLDSLVVAFALAAIGDQLGYGVRNAEAVVEHGALAQFLGSAARDRLPNTEWLRRLPRHQPAPLPRDRGVVGDVVGHGLIGIDHDRVDQYSGHADGAGR